MTLQFDGLIDIATGRSRKETSWKNKEVQWSKIVERLSKTQRTHETHAEYLAEKKPRQDEIKDIGGFVGGYLAGGRRKAGNVTHRQLITLDIDFAKADAWENFTLLYSNAAAMYSTHKHSTDHPRLRLILPLDRKVFPDEYMAISRKVAGNLGINSFDHTTFQPERLMYWPSTSKDGAYVFEYQDGEFLSADEVLNSYHDWRDSSAWPRAKSEDEIVLKEIKKQGDPLEKKGIVGAYCRAKGMHEVLTTVLSDVYEATDVENRYTYKHGSTAAGLIVYDDKYAFSHHGTDPVSNKLCNAFDVVRIHLFGLKDEDAKQGTPIHKMPSYAAMEDFACKDPEVKKLIVEEQMSSIAEAFDGVEIEDTDSDEWKTLLEVDRKGNIVGDIGNVALILENSPQLKGRICFDEFEHREIAVKKLPWRNENHTSRYIKDSDIANLKLYLKDKFKVTVSTPVIEDSLQVLYERKRVNSVRQYLTSVNWDEEPRVDRLLIDYLGAENTEYTRTVTRKILVAAVARIFEPGCKFDNMLTIVGLQGIGKSTIINKLGGKWFSDSFNFHMLGDKEAYEQLQGAWLVEVGELTGLKKADIESAKSFLSKREDRFRVAYGRRIEEFPRQCVFFGSTNNDLFLRDSTGNRRFWPVTASVITPAKDIWKDLTKSEIDQVWAEAVWFYRKGETLHLDREIEETARKTQASHTEEDIRVGMIQKYLETLLPDNWEELDIYQRRAYLTGGDLQPEGVKVRDRVCVAEIWCEVLGGTIKDMNTNNTKFIHDAMIIIQGWKKLKSTRKFSIYGYQRVYVRQSENEILTNTKSETSTNTKSVFV